MSKKSKTAWILEWCEENQETLERYRGFVIALHPEHGVVNADRHMVSLRDHARFLKKKLVDDLAYVWASDHLPPLDDERLEGGKRIIARPDSPNMDPYREEAEELPVPEKDDPPPPLNGVDLFENPTDVGTFNPPPVVTGSLNPFPSPDKQPPFMPRQPSPSFDRDILIDGGGAAWRSRSPRID